MFGSDRRRLLYIRVLNCNWPEGVIDDTQGSRRLSCMHDFKARCLCPDVVARANLYTKRGMARMTHSGEAATVGGL